MDRDFSIDLKMFTIAILELTKGLTQDELAYATEKVVEANRRGRLGEFLLSVEKHYQETTNLAPSFTRAYWDLFLDRKEKN